MPLFVVLCQLGGAAQTTYFIYGWTRVIAEVFHVDIPTSGPTFDEICRIAAEAGKPAAAGGTLQKLGKAIPTTA